MESNNNFVLKLKNHIPQFNIKIYIYILYIRLNICLIIFNINLSY